MKNKMSELAKISKEYKYTKDEFSIIATIVCSSQMYDNGYSQWFIKDATDVQWINE